MTPIAEHDSPQRWTLRGYLDIALRRRWYIIASTIIAVIAVLSYSLTQSPRYEASTILLLRPQMGLQIFSGQSVNAIRSLSNEVSLIQSEAIADLVKQKLGHSAKISAVPSDDADVITLRARAANAEDAALIANTFAEVYLKSRAEESVSNSLSAAAEIQSRLDKANADLIALNQPLDSLTIRIKSAIDLSEQHALEDEYSKLASQSEAQRAELSKQQSFLREQLDRLTVSSKIADGQNATVLERATAPSEPVAPRPLRDLLFGIFAGLAFGLALALLRDQLDDSVRSEPDVNRAWPQLPVLAAIPKMPKGSAAERSQLVSLNQSPGSSLAEAYRTLRTAIGFITIGDSLPIIQITSSVAGEGKTTTTANLIASLAEAGVPTLGICCDLRKPKLHEHFGISNDVGLSSLIIGTHTMAEAIVPAPNVPNASIIACGPIPPNPSELLSQQRTIDLISEAATLGYGAIVLDSPPALPVTDAIIISQFATATVVVARSGVSERLLARSLNQLSRARANVVGVVLNAAKLETPNLGYYSDYYYRESDTDGPVAAASSLHTASDG